MPEAGEIPTANKRWGQVSNPGNLTPVPRCLPPGYRTAPPSTPSLLHPGSSSGVRETGTCSRTAPLHHCSSLFRGFPWSPPGSPHPTYLLLCSQCDFCPAITRIGSSPCPLSPIYTSSKTHFLSIVLWKKKIDKDQQGCLCSVLAQAPQFLWAPLLIALRCTLLPVLSHRPGCSLSPFLSSELLIAQLKCHFLGRDLFGLARLRHISLCYVLVAHGPNSS